jgi:hypothetical protein
MTQSVVTIATYKAHMIKIIFSHIFQILSSNTAYIHLTFALVPTSTHPIVDTCPYQDPNSMSCWSGTMGKKKKQVKNVAFRIYPFLN